MKPNPGFRIHTRPQLENPVPGLDYDGSSNRPAVASSFYDFIPRQSRRLIVSIGDLHVPARTRAITTSCVRALLHGLAMANGDDLELMARELNRTLRLLSSPDFAAALFYASFDPVRRVLSYLRTEFEPPLLIRARSRTASKLEGDGGRLGNSNGLSWRTGEAQIEPGDVFVALAGNPGGRTQRGRWFEAEVVNSVLEHPYAAAKALTRRLLTLAGIFTVADERPAARCAVVVRYVEPPRPHLAASFQAELALV